MARMPQAVVVFLIGFVGWLGASLLHVQGPAVFVVALAVGVVAGVRSPRLIFLPLLWFGMLASYPAAIGLGIMAFLGENWAVYVLLFLAITGAGFGASIPLRQIVSGRAVGTDRRTTQ